MPVPVNFSSPIRITAKNRAFLQLQEWIIDGTLQPQEKLNDAELAQALGVSRTPVREALQLLNVQGFVQMYPGVGTQVTPVKKSDITKILPPLASLQALAAEYAVQEMTSATLSELKELNQQFSQYIKKGDFYNALKTDEQFHHLIIHSAENPYLTNSISNLQGHVFRLYFHQSIIMTAQSVQEHEDIIHAIESKDVKMAGSIARQNWLRAIDEFYAEHGV
ncbi:GntR family transcriptional regulator [Cytobacillus gottheilii]|uniref:GntR family transcriptional regulator n=1 Tax=Cytobacillus gottheilii TaxID=859144 RepID=UPI0009B9AAE1|nr:GntR family transcriptional regulator [Cytobacillus gottheilii]